MMPAPRTPTCCTGFGCTVASLTPGSFCKRWVMKKTAIRLREMGLPTSVHELLGLDLQPSSSGRLQPLAMASSAASGAGYWPPVLAITWRGRRRT